MSLMEIAAPFVGAATFEVVHWYDSRHKLGETEHAKAVKSVGYWVITALMISLGGIGTLILFGDVGDAKLYLIGAAFPTVLKKLVGALDTTGIVLGDEPKRNTFKDYFLIGVRR